MLYHAYQAQTETLRPLHAAARTTLATLGGTGGTGGTGDAGRRRIAAVARTGGGGALRRLAAACAVIDAARLTHQRPAFGIESVQVDGETVAVVEEAALVTPFATLLHFAKPALAGAGRPEQPKVLLAAPMSGHFATLLRDTVRTMLADHDVYVTDWHNARDVPLSAGRFGLDEYTDHLIAFLAAIGEGAHLMAVCQPCVASLAAVAVMSEDGHPATPRSLTLMAGPIDCRVSPTAVNRLAVGRPIAWFEQNLVSRVPWQHAGRGRGVYPGFVQVAAFMAMNRERHAEAFRRLHADLVAGDTAKAAPVLAFYDEYFAVFDLPAEFFLETVSRVFQEHDLPQGRLVYRGRTVDPRAVRRTALLTVEGERDDICSPGQTLAAQDLCASLRPYMRTHYVQPGAGHYGVFSGTRWSTHIYPMVRDTIHVSR